ncbi:acyltransferase [Massilia sp. Dwa41.01b]|uniref:acyltransferase family protein n=1 Tax=unclassified Massilia TaxID=2609279 RepID=UPI0016014573|nr:MULTISPECIES: acyltransferase [unclassified Massilia]QNA90840.1 acyltransferase [Massilia sp. Dwa41.01b]QNA98082.1 acyltransferase [Massilia sp. Se16.2.3]
MNDDASVSQRIALLRFLMIFGIVLLHAPPYVPIAEVANNPFDLFKAFFQHAVFRTTVPVLTCISGYLLFKSGLDQTPGKLASKKFRTIVLPFLVFNLGLLAAALGLYHGLGITLSNDMIPKDGKGWLNAAFGLTGSPINYPLNFLRDLVALMIVAPLLGWFLRKLPWVGLAIVALVYQFNLDGPFVLRNVMWPVFYVGGLVAVRGWNLRALDRYAPLCLALFLGLCAYVIWFRVANTNNLRLVAPLLIWPAAALLQPTAFGRWLGRMSKYSFFIFVAHAPVLLATTIVYKPFAAHVPYPVYWVLAPVLTTASLVLVYLLAMRLMPRLFSFVIGAKAPPTAARVPPGAVLAKAE